MRRFHLLQTPPQLPRRCRGYQKVLGIQSRCQRMWSLCSSTETCSRFDLQRTDETTGPTSKAELSHRDWLAKPSRGRPHTRHYFGQTTYRSNRTDRRCWKIPCRPERVPVAPAKIARSRAEVSSPEHRGSLLGDAMLHISPASLVSADVLTFTGSPATIQRLP
jgi:hypothetical protein